MAGIGFTLREQFRDDSTSLKGRAHAYASFAAAGPWMISVLSVALMSLLIKRFGPVGEQEARLFVVTVSYCFIFSQIFAGGWQLTITRYLTDHFCKGELDGVASSFKGISRLVLAVSTAAAVLFYWGSPLPFSYKLLSTLLFLAIGQIWLALVFLTAAKNYKAIAYAFVLGTAVSAGAVLILLRFPVPFSSHREITNMLLGYTSGMFLTMCMLGAVLVRAFPAGLRGKPYAILRYADKYPSLLAVGFLFNLGLWVDKVLVWLGPNGVTLESTFRCSPLYDPAAFLAYISVIPTVVLFAVSAETQFYGRYLRFYGHVTNGGTLKMIERSKHRMIEGLRRAMYRIAKIQGMLTLLLMLGSILLLGYILDDPITAQMFQVYVLGAMASTLMFLCILIMLYVEDRKGTVTASSLFFGLNVLFTLGVLPAGSDYYAFNYLLASFAAFAWSGWRLIGFLQRIEAHTFVNLSILPGEERGFFTREGKRAGRWL
ncbi:exopolysaccharide Pel transporter PelG [Paenibacillus filicis]|uniref:Exopolysaccharide Pel transporter PelG n=1 Tax=Paenibacillus gyeongsangnamensis TaxID=3388067 RepID=A0ABT4QCQ3_9BACL|nr:exopolysaccharide Pel transporter PelG [Paenibacillus filicis]MCZ8514662.1 exopolysaccharide Pel transporter PelG [Paenibacillus filicis]